jgi:hypothetical protein
MTSLYTVATLVHSVLVLSFMAVTCLLMIVSAMRRSRLRKVRLSWGSGRLYGLPLVPTLFLAIVVGLIGIEVATDGLGTPFGWVILLGYLAGGLFWYIGAVLAAAVVVTDWGLSRRRRGKSETIPWHEVTDYLEKEPGRRTTFVFFRVDERGKKQRFEIEVPASRLASFREMVEGKLDARYNYSVRRPAGRWAMKQ